MQALFAFILIISRSSGGVSVSVTPGLPQSQCDAIHAASAEAVSTVHDGEGMKQYSWCVLQSSGTAVAPAEAAPWRAPQ